ncbi:hypothetical protein GY45DRAFT_1368565 [Cubamyces sp. BRFM 1775]|nr:hypothetical protein GY45DRAFT_1368565 [Cubamyces sp. BRFM 1775]
MTKATVVYARRVDTLPTPEQTASMPEKEPTENNRARPRTAKRDPERRFGMLLSAEAVKQLRRLLHKLGDEVPAMQGGFF